MTLPISLTNCVAIMLIFFCSTAAAVLSPGEISVEKAHNQNVRKFNPIKPRVNGWSVVRVSHHTVNCFVLGNT